MKHVPVTTHRIVETAADLVFTGERFIPGLKGAIEVEHLHRYLFALQFCAGYEVLDIACGEGYGAKLLGATAKSVIGVDIDADSITRAERAYGSDVVRFRQGRAEALPLPSSSVDVVVSFETLEHFSEQEAFLGELVRVLRTDGLLIMSSPDRYAYDRAISEPNPFHVRELSTQEFIDLLRRHFANVVLGHQKVQIGSVIMPQSPDIAAGFGSEQFRRMNGAVDHSFGLVDAPYAIAVASNANLPPVRWSAYEDYAILEGFQRDHAKQVQGLEATITAARQESKEFEKRYISEKTEREVLSDRVSHLRAELDATTADRDALKQNIAHIKAELDGATQRLRRPTRELLAWLGRRAIAPYRDLRKIVRQRARTTAQKAADRPPSEAEENSSDYLAVSTAIADARKRRKARFKPRKPRLIVCPQDEMARFAEGLSVPPAPADPEISIVIPVYNEPSYVLECLAAIGAHTTPQTYEIILIDDCSDEETKRVLGCVQNIRLLRNESNLGFLRSCNKALEVARGHFVVFLNSDTQVQPSWLEPLLAPFAEEESVGAVGPKLVYPSGHLQEAGALINRDCSATLVGLTDDPDLPRYNRRHEVEYCSGACIVVKSATLKELGGFDLRYAPAYCEDADLSFRLRERGLKVIYEPKSLVIHHLSVSSDKVSKDYKLGLITQNQQKLSERWQKEIDELNAVRLIAFYLPQYHPIPENDHWWGKGFTEWSNVARAKPNFAGHEQPKVPADLGHYDLRLGSVMEAQAALAQRYGIYGFCYYYYWFGGKRLLEQPLERMLATGKPDIPFCVAWANENWTRRWDGKDQEILIAQKHSRDDDIAVIADLTRYLRHPNYIRVNGRPLLVIYRPTELPDIADTAALWRAECRRQGLGEIYLAMVDSFAQTKAVRRPQDIGFDAVIEFPPHTRSVQTDLPGESLNPRFGGRIYDYSRTAVRFMERELPDYPFFRGVIPRWDNTARQQDKPDIFYNATAGAYQAWLEAAIQDARETTFGDERLVFINAWNEWAEGAYLEPDRTSGHLFLEATRNSLDKWLITKT